MTATNVISLPEAESELGIDHGTQPLVATYVTSVSRLLDQACGPVVRRTVTEEYDGGRSCVILRQFPVAAVTAVTEYRGTAAAILTEETAATAPGDGFLLSDSGKLYRRSGKADALFASGRRNVVVSYSAGRYDDTASVDERFKRAAMVALRNLWSREQGMGTVTFGADGAPLTGATYALPNAARAFIQDDLLVSGLA